MEDRFEIGRIVRAKVSLMHGTEGLISSGITGRLLRMKEEARSGNLWI